MRQRFRRLVAATGGLTFVLLLLGVYTAAAGAGLTCDARWPLCDGAVFGLFPADWLSFIEWFHRFVAMITGFFILGTTAAAWLHDEDRRIKWGMTIATVILPAQVILGALTVTTYEWLILTLHFVTAMTIFTAIALSVLWTEQRAGKLRTSHVRRGASGVVTGLLLFLLLSPRLLVDATPAAQVAYYAIGLALYSTLLGIVVHLRGTNVSSGPSAAALLATLVLGVLLVFGRQNYGELGKLLTVAATLVVGVLTAYVRHVLSHHTDPRAGTLTGSPSEKS
jgi:cytochrome c oxidase assembly protein subunit 15